MSSSGSLALSAASAAILALSLAGCHLRYRADGVVESGASAHIDVSTSSRLGAAIIVGIIAAEGFRYYRVGPDGSRTPIGVAPDPDPTRRVNVQDCTRPVDPAAGNLLCR
jgi:hypothetical protein